MLRRGIPLGLCVSLVFSVWAEPALAQAPTGAANRSAPAAHAAHAPRAGNRAQLATGAVFGPDGRLWVVGVNTQQRLFVQHTVGTVLNDWAPPQLLDSGNDAISAEGENRPKIALGPQGWVVITYTQPLAKPYTGWIRLLRSTDGGQSFAPPVTLHRDRQEITHRFDSIAFDAQGRLHAAWLDNRDFPVRSNGQGHAGAAVYHNVSHDGGASFGPDLKLADKACECCRIALAPDRQGRLHALWRHVFDPDIRDHALGALDTDQPNRHTRASYDDWHIKACPHHGPALATADDDGEAVFHALWFGMRLVQGQGVAGVRYARLDARGAPILGTEQLVPDARAEHADLAAEGSRVALVWRSSQGAQTTLSAWLSRDGGRSFERRELAQVSGANDYPRLVRSGARMVVVWRTPQEVQTHELVF